MIFRNWVLENFPFLEDDFDALTDYELFCKMMEYIKEVAKDNKEILELLKNLQPYIDEKLDEMAEDGTLADIINQEIFQELNNKIGDLTDLTTTDKTSLVNAINEINRTSDVSPSKPLDMKKVIIIGDSYASRTNNWVSPLITKLGLENGDYFIGALGSTGFCCPNNNKVWLTLLEEIVENLTSSQKQEITHVIVCGGANDNTYLLSEIDTAIGSFVSYVNTNLPNAKTLIGEIGWTSDTEDIVNYGKVVEAYTKCNKYNKCYYLNNVQYTLHNYSLLESDKVHPTADGCSMLANNIHQCIINGYCDIVYNQLAYKLNPNDNNRTFYESLNNNLVSVYSNRPSIFDVSVSSIVANGVNSFELTDSIFQYAKGSYYETNKAFIAAYLNVNGTIREIYCNIGIYEGKLRLYPISYSQSGYLTLTNITSVRIPQFKIVMDALQC